MVKFQYKIMRIYKKSAMVYVGGELPPRNISLCDVDMHIAADSGVLSCKYFGCEADVVIGDFDSVSYDEARRVFPHAQMIVHDKYKDETDTELAIAHARKCGCDDITIIGGGGGSVDHFIGILYMFSRIPAPHRMIMKDTQIELITESFVARVEKEQHISFFPIIGQTTDTRQWSTGLEWNLDKHTLSVDFTSLRNIATDTQVRVTMERGNLIAVWKHHGKAQRCS